VRPGSVPRREPFEPSFWGSNLSGRERLADMVLADLLPHWGYENDPMAVSEAWAHSTACAPIRSYAAEGQ
jgi:hypothetical protein